MASSRRPDSNLLAMEHDPMSWQCPKCNSARLSVTVQVEAKLTQSEDNFETDADGDHAWDDDSPMTCSDCNFTDKSLAFATD